MIVPVTDILLGTLVFLRVVGMAFMVPFFSGGMIPNAVKVALWGMLALMVYPLLYNPAAVPGDVVGYGIAALKELLVGVLMGLAVKIFFEIALAAGAMISMEIGLTMSTTFDPMSQTQTTTVGNMLYYLCLFMVFVTNMHHAILDAFVTSYAVVPIGSAFPAFDGLESLVKGTALIITTGVQIAAPMIALSFVINLTFSILGKAAPKINVFVVSFAFRIMAGLFLLLSTLGLVVQYLDRYADSLVGRMIDFITF